MRLLISGCRLLLHYCRLLLRKSFSIVKKILYKYRNFRLSFEREIHLNLSVAYRERDWDSFSKELNRCGKKTITYQSWNAMKLGYFMELKTPKHLWKSIYEEANGKKHFLTRFAFRNYINTLITPSNFNELKKELPKFSQLYSTFCPLIYVPGICALYIKNKEYEDCLVFLNDLNKNITKEEVRAQFKLRSYSYYWVCNKNLKIENDSKSISDGLMKEMDKLYMPESPSRNVLDECVSCWQIIKSKSDDLLQDLRYLPSQEKKLQEKVYQALKMKEPFLLLRIGDGEAYAFAKYSKEYEEKIVNTLEDFWWGIKLSTELRNSLVGDFNQTLDDADIIGFPYTIRLSQVLHSFSPAKLTYSDIRLKVLYKGFGEFLKKSNKPRTWVDEYCNYAFVDEAYLSSLIDISTNVVLVTCFEIPEGNVFHHPKVKVVNAPAVKKVSLAEGVVASEKSLPEIISSLKEEINPHLTKGTLLLLSAGFAGKPILKLAKDKGAVAIDFGSSIDHVLGYKTRNLELHNLFS